MDMKNIVVYHWFGEQTDNHDVAKNIRCPLIVSIATLRAVDQETRIVVLNTSDTTSKSKQQWEPYSTILNFEMWEIEEYLKEFYSYKAGYRQLSRLFDISKFNWGNNKTILYSDADVFWLKAPFPTHKNPNTFCFDGYNTGLFYFNNSSKMVAKFFEIFEAYTIGALNNEQIRQQMKKYVGYDAWYYIWDEMIMTYMFQEHPELFNQITKEEHCCARDLKTQYIKAFHCNGLMIKNTLTGEEHARGLAGILIKEWWDAINKVMDPTMIFSKEELDHHLPMQFSILNEPERVTSTLTNDGHYQLT